MSSEAKLAEELEGLTEVLNRRLAEAERHLVALRPGVSASVPLVVGSEVRLAFRKDGANWGLFVDDVALLKASRAHRVQAAVKLGVLTQEIAKEQERTLVALKAANGALDEFLASFQ